MILKELLETLPDDRVIYVCAKSGAVAAGKRADVNNGLLLADVKNVKRLRQIVADKTEELNQAKGTKKEEKCKRALAVAQATVEAYIPFPQREVIESYERISEDAINILVTGDEVGSIWSIRGCEPVANYNLADFAAAILKGAVDEYRKVFREEIGIFRDEMKSIRLSLKKIDEYRERAEKWERYFRDPAYIQAIAPDPQVIIDIARKMVIDEINDRIKKVEEDE